MTGPCRRNTAERKRPKGGDASARTVDVWRWTMGRQRENRPLRSTTEDPASPPATGVGDVTAADRPARCKAARRKVGQLGRGVTRFPQKNAPYELPEAGNSCSAHGSSSGVTHTQLADEQRLIRHRWGRRIDPNAA